MRRKDREMPRDFAEQVIDKAAFATLATVNADGTPYAVPLSPVRRGEVLYFHGALEGKKSDNLKAHGDVCLSFVGDIHVPEGKFTIGYESATVFGTAEEVFDRDEKIEALRLISERYTPDNMADFDRAVAASLEKTGIWKIRIREVTGKCSRQ